MGKKIMAKLTNAALEKLIERPGRHGDGQGLFFRTPVGFRPSAEKFCV